MLGGILIKEMVFSLGFILYLCGMFLFCDWASYRSFVYVFLFLLPVLLFSKERGLWKGLFSYAVVRMYLLILFFSAFSLLWSDASGFSYVRHIVGMLMFGLSLLLLSRAYPALIMRCLGVSAIVAALSAIYGLVSFYIIPSNLGSRFIVDSGLLSHTILASFVYGFFFIVAIYLWRSSHYSGVRAVFLVSSVVLLVYLIFAQSRGVLLAVFCAVVCDILLRCEKYRWVYVILLVLFVSVMTYLNQEYFLDRGWSYRIDLWVSGVMMGVDNFWFGRGIYSDYTVTVDSGLYWDHPHNIFVKIFIDIGALGLLLWCGVWALACRGLLCLKNDVEVKFLGVSLIIFSMVAGMFDGDGPFVKPREVWFISWLPLVLCIIWSLEGEGFSRVRKDAHDK